MSTKNVAFLTLDWTKNTNPIEPNGCAWYRCYLPMLELHDQGWEIGMGMPEYEEEHGFGVFKSKDLVYYGWDIIVLKLIMLKSVAEIMKNKKPNQKIVVDIDDFFEGLQPTNLAWQNTDPEKNPENNRQHYWDIIDHADAIITSTQFLYDFYTKEKGYKNVFLVRNGIDIERWQRRRDHSRWMPVFGWVGATPWRSNDLEQMNPFFGKFLEKNRLEFHHSGHIKEINISAADLMGLPNTIKFTHEPRRVLSQYPQMFRKIDVGIVPLNDIPFNHAKSTIKGLEYTAAGVPFIASYSPEYKLLADQGVGRVAHSQEEWEQHLNELLDPVIRKNDIERNYELVKQNHSIKSRAKDWDEVMTNILDL